jgi:UDP-N-acetylglucosamine--N-acetylmuramyl-(pentapeptide) pyrophosphoryl-undecaprenol N-acetylglucosamine transferase
VRRVLFAGGGTGGHLYPALALADAMMAEASDIEVHFVGARRGIETTVLPKRGVPHTLLPMEPLYRSRPWRNVRLVPALTSSFIGIARLFRRFRPQLVVATGGYASGPAGMYASWRGIPMAVQEQNAHAGATAKLLARRATQVHLGFPEAERELKPGPRTRVLSLGNPIRPPDADPDRDAVRDALGLARESTVVLIVGGSQGANAINETIMAALRDVGNRKLERLAGVEILWATGPNHFDSVRFRVGAVGADAWVHSRGYIDDMPRALAATDIAVSRAGAMMTAELLAWGIPSILVPLPTAAADHQTYNARALEAAGAAVCMVEDTMTPASLWAELSSLTGDVERRQRMASAARERARPDAAREIARELITLLPEASR